MYSVVTLFFFPGGSNFNVPVFDIGSIWSRSPRSNFKVFAMLYFLLYAICTNAKSGGTRGGGGEQVSSPTEMPTGLDPPLYTGPGAMNATSHVESVVIYGSPAPLSSADSMCRSLSHPQAFFELPAAKQRRDSGTKSGKGTKPGKLKRIWE
jgi:hypothetical protein